ncbi:hypothetical protein OIV83_003442 [Microbotryomycetes sp. JL201]|nr:hypothetical protein OIV83_003442 [Microbotryomycetes sp. JL201]
MPVEARPDMPAAHKAKLVEHSVPLESLEDACTGCSEFDGDDIDGYPSGFDIDMDSVMLGSVKPYGRQILIATGKKNWEREVTDSGLPSYIKLAYDERPSVKSSGGNDGGGAGFFNKLTSRLKRDGQSTPKEDAIEGIFDSAAQLDRNGGGIADARLSIVSASFQSSSFADAEQSIIVLPDFKIVQGVAQTKDAANHLVEQYLDPTIGRTGLPTPPLDSGLKSWPLPYYALVLVCSHKRRDKRCHIAAPLLVEQFHRHLHRHDMEVDERGDDIHCPEDASIESWPVDGRDNRFDEELQGVKSSQRVGLFHISHIGGHRYAGNVIIYLPNGASVWYGRVTPKDVGPIVEATILKGKIIPELLRGGMGLAGKQGPGGVLSW